MKTEYSVKTVKDKKTWEDFVLSCHPQTFLQSWNWGETNRQMGHKIFRLGFYNKDKLIGLCLILKEEARRGPHLIIPGGPIIDWNNKDLVEFFMFLIKRIAKEEKVWFVRVRPEISASPENNKFFRQQGFVPAPMHLHAENTWVLDITLPVEKLLGQMRKSTRYLIKKSLTLGLKFEKSVNPHDSKILKRLQDETMARHGFVGFSEKLFETQIGIFGEDNQGVLFLCRKAKDVLAAAVIIFYGDVAYYHHSGSSSRFLDIPSSYFIQWNIIQEAKKRGCRYYNFWGIAPTDDPKHRFAGVTLFKKGFGGKRIDWLHAHDLPTSNFYWVTYIFETIRRISRRL